MTDPTHGKRKRDHRPVSEREGSLPGMDLPGKKRRSVNRLTKVEADVVYWVNRMGSARPSDLTTLMAPHDTGAISRACHKAWLKGAVLRASSTLDPGAYIYRRKTGNE